MFGINELKNQIEITESTVECPVKDCSIKVVRQRQVFKKEKKYQCPIHKIYISPTTFEYEREQENLLWTDQSDMLYNEILKVKRESRIARDNSEDAVTWNVFRFLEKNNLVAPILGSLINSTLESPEIIYWSYSQKENNTWSELKHARKEFGEADNRGSEPDIIIKANNALLFVEAKFTAGNETEPSGKNDSKEKKYKKGCCHWFSKVFKSDFDTIAIKEKKYELLRYWLIGTCIANHNDLDFYLINLVLSEREKDIEDRFKKHIYENKNRKFMRITWEDIYNHILDSNIVGKDRDLILNYFRNKAVGYDGSGKLKRAFSIC